MSVADIATTLPELIAISADITQAHLIRLLIIRFILKKSKKKPTPLGVG
jgi:hypothetical protein